MKRWPNIYPFRTGFIVDCGVINGKRDRKYFPSKTAADREAARRRDERDRGRLGALSISDADLLDAVTAKRILAGTGITLESLARSAVKNVQQTGMTVQDLYTRYLEQRTSSGIRPRSTDGIKAREGKFTEVYGQLALSDLTPEHINEWLSSKNWAPVSKNAHLRGVRSMLNYAVKNGLIEKNPASSLEFVKITLPRPTVFSVKTVDDIMRWLEKNQPKLVPYYAIAFFAGIRPDEARRLGKENIDLSGRIVTVEPESSKTHMRHVDIQPNLHAWLTAYPVNDSVYWSRKIFRRMIDKLCISWGHDVARKSFISYHLAAFRNQNETVMQAGHRSSDMIFTHYRNIQTQDGQRITADYAADYWGIFPNTQPNTGIK